MPMMSSKETLFICPASHAKIAWHFFQSQTNAPHPGIFTHSQNAFMHGLGLELTGPNPHKSQLARSIGGLFPCNSFKPLGETTRMRLFCFGESLDPLRLFRYAPRPSRP